MKGEKYKSEYLYSKYCLTPSSRFISPQSYWSPNNKQYKIKYIKGEKIIIGKGTKFSAIIFDFGREIGGYLKIFWGKVSGGSVRFYFSESLNYIEPAGDVVWDPFFFRFTLFCQHKYFGEGNHWWQASMVRGGFRYLLIKPSTNTKAEIKEIQVRADFYIPKDGTYEGKFECSDDELNKIWYSSAYTMQVATKHSWGSFVFGNDKVGEGEWVIFDGAKRDRAVWALDLAICIPSYLLSLWNPNAVRDSLLTLLSQKCRGGFAFKPGYIPHSAFPMNRFTWLTGSFTTFTVYVMWWIRGVFFYYLYTGDDEFVRNVFKDIIGALKWIESQTIKSPQSKTPLIFANGFNDLSWDYTINRFGVSGATNLVWVKTLEETSWMAKNIMHDEELAFKYLEKATRIRKAVFETGFFPFNLWDEKLQRFRHTTFDDTPFTLEVNAQAVCFDFVKGDLAQNLLSLIAKRLHTNWGPLSSDKPFPFILQGQQHNRKVMPSLAAFEVSALMKYERYEEAIELTKKTWLPMLKQGTETTFWEWYGENGKPPSAFGSLCHPWSAWILQVLSENFTGIRPLKGGFSEFALEPTSIFLTKDIEYASFCIPTPSGHISGKWNRTKEKVIYEIYIPEGICGKIQIKNKSITCKNEKGVFVNQVKKEGRKQKSVLYFYLE